MKAVEQFTQPRRALAAPNAPAAGFVRIKMHDPPRQIHHARFLVNNYQAARTQHRADFRHRVIIHRYINFIRRKQRTRASAGYHRLQLLAILHTAGDIFNHALQIKTHRQLVDSGLIDVAGNGVQPRPAVFWRSERGAPVAALSNDCRRSAERFHVIDYCGATVEPDGGGEWRLDARIAALAFERFHQRGFFAALVGTRSRVRRKLKIESGAQDVFPQVASRIGLADRALHDVDYVVILAANVDVPLLRADGPPGDQHPLDQR